MLIWNWINVVLITNFDNFNFENAKNLICQNGLVILRNATLSMNSFEHLIKKIGKLLVTEKHVLNQNKTVQEISHAGLFGSGDVAWHNDWSYGKGNFFGTALYNFENAQLSETWFQDMSNLPSDFYTEYSSYEGTYLPPQEFSYCFTDRQRALIEKQKISRKFVFNHPITNELILYCSPGTLQNPHPNIDKITEFADNNAYVHSWKIGDLLLFDNYKMMHKRKAFNGTRTLWRIQFIL